MKKTLAAVMMSAALLSLSHPSHAEQYDDPACFSQCDTAYNSCIAGVINLPEPRTFEEQQLLDTCRQTYGDCQHSCETANKPLDPPPKQEEGK